MANLFSARRVKFQDIDNEGKPIGEPTYGVIVADDHTQDYINGYRTIEELNLEIEEAGNLVDLVGDVEDKFDDLDADAIGKDNYFGPYPKLSERR